MAAKKQLTIYLAISMLAVTVVLTGLPHTAAQTKVNITFTATGYDNYSGTVLVVNGVSYSRSNLPVTLSLTFKDTFTVTAISPITGWDSNVYTFSSWTNGDTLTTASGTYSVPNKDTTVTANYIKSTHTATFSTSGLTNMNNNVLQIDGTSYTVSGLGSKSFLWLAGSIHTVVALQPVYSYDTPPIGYNFSSWTNGNGLVSASGTFTMPTSDVTVTANYQQSTVQVTFATTGLSNLNQDTILTIDGTTYSISNIPNIKFQWMKSSTHSITAVSSVTGYDTVKHDFSSWTNGNGLVTNTGTFTTPNSNVIVTANYVISTTTNHVAKFATTGLSNINGNALQIDGVNYTWSNIPSLTFTWATGSKHNITALEPVYDNYPGVGYNFSSWTNGNGLVTASGTFTMPNADVTVTANYVQSTVQVAFTTSGLVNIDSYTLLTIDGVTYNQYDLMNANFQWLKTSTHNVTAVTRITGTDDVKHDFSSWTNGNGLITSSGTFTTPNSNVIVTANYVQSSVQVTFTTFGLVNIDSYTLLTIDGTTYNQYDLVNANFQWLKTSTHNITAVSTITGTDNVKHDFSSWTNGNGLVTYSGTFTTPNSNVIVTANYVISTTTNHVAKFATTGLSDINGNALLIDGVSYAWSSIPSLAFTWAVGSNHTITALQPVYDYSTPPKGFNFTSWTNGNGLVTASGTFTMPNSDVTVTANYAQSTVQVTFATGGLGTTSTTNMSAGVTILTVDGVNYDFWGIINFKAQWMKGSTHSVTAVASITGWDNVKMDFSGWTNGDGLTSNTGTYTTPTSDVLITANYIASPTTSHVARFAVGGVSNLDVNVLQIDGVTYKYSELASKSFLWAPGTNHTVIALQPIYSYETPQKGYNFSSWTNGNGLVTTSGIFTMPSSDVNVTANYVQVTVKVTFATSGLGIYGSTNMTSGVTILIIDGTSYDFWQTINFEAQWMKGSTHSVTAVTSVTGWDGVKHYFRSWTNGNGLTSNSGTFTTPTSDVSVIANYGLTSTITTTVTVECSVTSVTPGSPVTIMGTLTGEGLGVAVKTISLSYYNGASWVSIGSATTTSSGSYSYGWTIPSNIANGEYPLKASFGGDVLYLASSGSTGTPGNGGNVHVLPESDGSIVVLFACLAGTIIFLGVRSRKSKRTA